MSDSPDSTRCSRCGTAFAAGSSPLGLCPACLLALGMSGEFQSPDLASQTAPAVGVEDATVAHARRHRWLAIPLIALVIAIVTLLALLIRPRVIGTPAVERVVRFTLSFPINTDALDGPQFAVSPDGGAIVLAANSEGRSRLYLRQLQSFDWRELPHTEGAAFPFWSPDSRHIGFFADRHVKTLDLSNTLTQTIADAPKGHGAAWGTDNTIVFASSDAGPLLRVPASGGTPQTVTKLDQGRERAHLWPQFLADGRHLVFFVRSSEPRTTGLRLLDLNSGATTLVAASSGAVVDGDRLLFTQDDALVAQRLDLARLELIPEDARRIAGADDLAGAPSFAPPASVSRGVLLYGAPAIRQSQLTWLDRRGEAYGQASEPGEYRDLAIAPDGRTLVVAREVNRGTVSNLWLIDLARGASSRLTFGGNEGRRDSSPIWSPDGAHLVFASQRNGREALLSIDSRGGGGKEEQLAVSERGLRPTDWSFDGRLVLYTSEDAKTGLDIWAVQTTAERRASAILQTPANETDAHLSPDGRWLAYVSDEAGRNDVYVQAFPDAGRRWLVSAGGGSQPRWRIDGRELLFVNADGMVTSTSVDGEGDVRVAPERPLFSMRGASELAVTRDAQRFLVRTPLRNEHGNELHVVLNWRSELR